MIETTEIADETGYLVEINRQAKSLVHYEVESGTGVQLWSVDTYGRNDDYLFYDRLVGTFTGVGSEKDALRQSRLIKVIHHIAEEIIDGGDTKMSPEEWAAKLHGAYVVSDALSRMMPGVLSANKRLDALTATPLKSGKTLLHELLLLDVKKFDTCEDNIKVETIMDLLEEITEKVNTKPRNSYYQQQTNLD